VPLVYIAAGDGETAIVVRMGLATTVRAMVVVWVREPEVPVMVTVVVPTVARGPAVNVTVLVPVAGFVP